MPISLKAIIESLLFTADAPMSLDRLCDMLEDHGRDEIRSALRELAEMYASREGGIHITEVAGGWQFRTRADLQQYVQRHVKSRPVRFSQSALETLAIIAYRQPVTRSEIEYLRGVDSGGVLKSLLEKKLVRILGKKDIPGRPIIYGTSRDFLEVFGLKDLKGLPTLKEITALDDVPLFEQQDELPLDGSSNSVEKQDQLEL